MKSTIVFALAVVCGISFAVAKPFSLSHTPFDPNTWEGPWNDIQNAGQVIPGDGKYRVNIKNESKGDIYVCIHFMANEWITEGWWKLGPGETKHVLNTKNRILYFHAQDGRGHGWGNKDHKFPIVNRKFKFYKGNAERPKDSFLTNFSEANMGEKFCEYTYSFRL